MLAENNKDTKAFLKMVKRFFPGEKKSVPNTIKLNGRLSQLAENSVIADTFNYYFVGTVSLLVS